MTQQQERTIRNEALDFLFDFLKHNLPSSCTRYTLRYECVVLISVRGVKRLKFHHDDKRLKMKILIEETLVL